MDFLRIGTVYYKKSKTPLMSGDSYSTLLKWAKGEIITDYGKEYLSDVPKYDGFCLIPSHMEFKEIVNGYYNNYQKLDHQFVAGEYPTIKMFLGHIFGEQYDIGIDYLKILWQYPTQILPILCLVSEERNTGKTTFLNFLKLIFQGNMTINTNDDFRSRFNTDWTSKLIVSVDEVFLDRKEDSERIKNLSTTSTFKEESKGINKVEIEFFGKFVLCSNNECNFIKVDDKEIRYWVRKVPVLKLEQTDLLDDLKKELPYFMNYLNSTEVKTKKETRMWFSKNDLHTDALDKLINFNKSDLYKEIREILLDEFAKFEVEELKYTLRDLNQLLTANNVRLPTNTISNLLKTKFNLTPVNGSYPQYYISYNLGQNVRVDKTTLKGRYFTFIKADVLLDYVG